jgi:hypothetical protein
MPAISLPEQKLLVEACAAFQRATRRFKARPARIRAARLAKQLDVDSTIQFELNGRKFDVPVYVNSRLDSPGIAVAFAKRAGKLGAYCRTPMLVTQYVGPELAGSLIASNVHFLDAAGNVFFEEPEGTVMITGRPKPAGAVRAPNPRATTRKGLQVMFALATQPDLVTKPYRAIAEASGVALSTANEVIDDLSSRGLVATKRNNGRIMADWNRFVQEWVSFYPSRLRVKLGPRRFTGTSADWWRSFNFAEFDARLGGEAAADLLTNELKAANVTIYTHKPLPSRFMLNARLRPDEHGNVQILEAFWPSALEQGWPAHDPPMVHPFLIYADLVASSDSRNLSVAERIYEQHLAQHA